MSIAELRAQRAQLMEESSRLLAITDGPEKRELTPEESAKFDELMAKVDDHDARIAALEAEMVPAEPEPAQNSRPIGDLRSEHAKRMQTRKVNPAPGFVRDYNDRQWKKDQSLAFRGWAAGKAAKAESFAAAERLGVDIRSDTINIRFGAGAEERAQTVTTSGGGYLVPTDLVRAFDKKLAAICPIRQYARILNTESGNPITLPTVDDTSNSAALTAINTSRTATDITFGQTSLGAYNYSSTVLVPRELMRDSGIPVDPLVGELLADRIGRGQIADLTTGTGSGQPQGIITGAATGKTAASATAITINEVLDLKNSMDVAYQDGAVWMMHQNVFTYLLKLQDSQGRQLINPMYQVDNKPVIWGQPVIINNSMASAITTGLKTICYFQPSEFWIRDVGGLEIRRLDELYAGSNQVGFQANGAIDAKVIQSGAVKLLVQL